MQDDAVPAPVLGNGIHYFGLVSRAEKMLILQFVEGRIGAGADIDAVKRNPAFQFADILVPLGMGAAYAHMISVGEGEGASMNQRGDRLASSGLQ